ncbi:hypothetical protein V6N13_068299 [Hibiscus sabdariffa]
MDSYIAQKVNRDEKRFGFVRFSNRTDANRAIERLNGFKLYDYKLSVSFAKFNTRTSFWRRKKKAKDFNWETRRRSDNENLWKLGKCLVGTMAIVCLTDTLRNPNLKKKITDQKEETESSSSSVIVQRWKSKDRRGEQNEVNALENDANDLGKINSELIPRTVGLEDSIEVNLRDAGIDTIGLQTWIQVLDKSKSKNLDSLRPSWLEVVKKKSNEKKNGSGS